MLEILHKDQTIYKQNYAQYGGIFIDMNIFFLTTHLIHKISFKKNNEWYFAVSIYLDMLGKK